MRLLYETPALADDSGQAINRERASTIIESVRRAGRTILTEVESKDVLAAYGIPITETRVAPTADAAAEAAQALGFP
jgi:acetyltransferase